VNDHVFIVHEDEVSWFEELEEEFEVTVSLTVNVEL
jgi:hypothetical protein